MPGVVVVGADGGIGAATAARLAAGGWRVVGLCGPGGAVPTPDDSRDRSPGRDACPGGGIAVPAHPWAACDVTDPTAVAAAAAAARAALGGPPDAVVIAAGVPHAGPIALTTADELSRVLAVNVVGAHNVAQAFLGDLIATRGRLVVLSSVSGRLPVAFLGAYTASKFALDGWAACLRREVAPLGVRVIVVAPGAVGTGMKAKASPPDPAAAEAADYAPAYGRFLEGWGADGVPPERVAERIARVLSARRPPARVVVAARPWRTRAAMARAWWKG